MTSAQAITIRPLHPTQDLPAVTAFLVEAADYALLADGHAPGPTAAADFFTDTPPGCDPAMSHRLGLFHDSHLSGLAELSFGFPEPTSAYLGLLILAPRVRGLGFGPIVLTHVETLARAAGALHLYLAVLEVNLRGAAFWERHGFRYTGLSGTNGAGRRLHRLVKPL